MHRTSLFGSRSYPISKSYYEKYIKRLNSKNITIQHQEILGDEYDEDFEIFKNLTHKYLIDYDKKMRISKMKPMSNADFEPEIIPETNVQKKYKQIYKYYEEEEKPKKSDNFEIIQSPINFQHVGGYESIKKELEQCVDIFKNYTKYKQFNVRVPKGIIFYGPPGNGKTMIAKSFAGEAKIGFIAVSGSEFQEKYVGVGASRVRELFKLAKDNHPCIIFIDEIDAIGRKRESDMNSAERDSTLNQLLVAMDGFHQSGVFIIASTNRLDLLDPALIRPGRIDKKIYIDYPDKKTRRAVVDMHIQGKPNNIQIPELIENTVGLSCSQIENILNEAMLNALREDREIFTKEDIDVVMNKIIGGWQPNEHEFSNNIIDHIAIHEIGHAIIGLLSTHHSKMKKVVINLSSPNMPGYTLFEPSKDTIYTREALFEHLMILLGGRIAEEVYYNTSVTTGAINDFNEAIKLGEKMIIDYGMGKFIYPTNSNKYKEIIDEEISVLLKEAYDSSTEILINCKDLLEEASIILKTKKILTYEDLLYLISEKYNYVLLLR